MMNYDVAALGELLIDFTQVSLDGSGYPTMAAHPGGAPANLLAAVAKLGGSAAMIGMVGEDSFGRLLTGTLTSAGIDASGIASTAEAFTTLAFVTLDEHGDRSFSFARTPGADTMLRYEDIDLPIIDRCCVLHFGTLSLTHEPSRTATMSAVQYALDRGKTVSFDPNLRRSLWSDMDAAKEAILWGLGRAQSVKLSEEELSFALGEMDYNEGIDLLHRKYGAELVMLTLGGAGCILSNGGEHIECPALAGVTPIDTTGAGDIFGGAALWRLLQTGKAPRELNGDELREIGRFACAAAGLSTMKHGGIQSVPALSEVLARI